MKYRIDSYLPEDTVRRHLQDGYVHYFACTKINLGSSEYVVEVYSTSFQEYIARIRIWELNTSIPILILRKFQEMLATDFDMWPTWVPETFDYPSRRIFAMEAAKSHNGKCNERYLV